MCWSAEQPVSIYVELVLASGYLEDGWWLDDGECDRKVLLAAGGDSGPMSRFDKAMLDRGGTL